ncbi:haloacid dehalogenase-like hydrolase domain-containing protein Sgpp [Salvia divinorum]|uniref:Haloacid dehalogenase-like hydrolase domain-containing protein Sgpp n=1 Tax=Salvia divinorum TaxID=28513 RepID=A0ABD1I018_SALDI
MGFCVTYFRCSSLASVAPLEAILFDIDGTLADSDPIHYYAFREMLQELGYNGGEPITEEFFITNISGKHNEELCQVLFPDWELQRARKFFVDKEAMFRRTNGTRCWAGRVVQMGGRQGSETRCSHQCTKSECGDADLNAGAHKFVELVVIGNECERPKPFPDPYLNALKGLGVSADHAFVFEDSVSGIKAGMPVVGLALRNPESMLTEAGAAMVIKDYTETKLWTALEEIAKKKEELKVT